MRFKDFSPNHTHQPSSTSHFGEKKVKLNPPNTSKMKKLWKPCQMLSFNLVYRRVECSFSFSYYRYERPRAGVNER